MARRLILHIQNVKIYWEIRLLTHTSTSSITPSGSTTLLLARWMTTPIGFKSPRCSALLTDVGMTLIEAPRSSMASIKVQSAKVQHTVKVSGSLHFYGKVDGAMVAIVLLYISAETFLPIFIGLFPFSFFLWVHKSFKNFAYFGICLMASKRGMLTSTLLKVSRRSKSSFTFYTRMDLKRIGRGLCFGVESVLAISSILAPTSIEFGSSWPLLKVNALTFLFGFRIGCAGILPEPCCCNWLTIVANCPIWVCRSWMVALIFLLELNVTDCHFLH